MKKDQIVPEKPADIVKVVFNEEYKHVVALAKIHPEIAFCLDAWLDIIQKIARGELEAAKFPKNSVEMFEKLVKN